MKVGIYPGSFDPEISEWGNPAEKTSVTVW